MWCTVCVRCRASVSEVYGNGVRYMVTVSEVYGECDATVGTKEEFERTLLR